MKQVIEERYKYFISCLSMANKEIEKLKGVNSSFSELQLSFCNALEKQAEISRVQMEEAMHGTIWDNLVIAFFGETGAGKSTIIETFRILYDKDKEKGQDGLIVGEGQADFTKECHEYQLSINDRPFTLIDVPGIEGNETEEIRSEIQHALRKAHCVFYVQRNDKQPDRATTEKIRHYLSDWVSVYSIHNVRSGGAFDYDEEEERVDLYTEDVQKVTAQITEIFKQTLGDIYKGNLSVQALLALCSVAHFSEKRDILIETQRELQEYFDSNSAMWDFCRMSQLVDLVMEKSNNFQEEIVESNKQKLESLAKTTYRSINQIILRNKEKETELRDSLVNFKRDVNQIFDETKGKIQNTINAQHRKLYNDIKLIAYDVIDAVAKDKEGILRCMVDMKVKNSQKELKSQLTAIIDETKQKLDQKRKALDGLRSDLLSMNQAIDLNISINLNAPLKELDVSLKDVGSFLSALGSGALAGSPFGGWVGATVGAYIGGLSYILRHWIFGDGGKSKAKIKVQKVINDERAKDKTPIELNAKISQMLDQAQNNIIENTNLEIRNIEALGETIEKTKGTIREYVQSLKYSGHGSF